MLIEKDCSTWQPFEFTEKPFFLVSSKKNLDHFEFSWSSDFVYFGLAALTLLLAICFFLPLVYLLSPCN